MDKEKLIKYLASVINRNDDLANFNKTKKKTKSYILGMNNGYNDILLKILNGEFDKVTKQTKEQTKHDKRTRTN